MRVLKRDERTLSEINENVLKMFSEFRKTNKAMSAEEEAEKLYALSNNIESGEIHLHEVEVFFKEPELGIDDGNDIDIDFNKEPVCNGVPDKSLLKIDERVEAVYDVQQIRLMAAIAQNNGYEICGRCVATLYKTEEQ